MILTRTTHILVALLMAFAFGTISFAATTSAMRQATAPRTIRDFFTYMPNDIAPMLTPDYCMDLMDYYDSNMAAKIKNDWGGRTTLKQLDRLYLLMQDDNEGCVNTELALLITGRDTIICVNRTLRFPQAESVLSFYNTKWEPLNAKDYLTMPAPADFPAIDTGGQTSHNSIQTISAQLTVNADGSATLLTQLNQDAGFADYKPDTTLPAPTLTYKWENRKFIRKQ